MSSNLRKPKSAIFRSYLYLDSDVVLNSLSAIEGGDVDEVLTRMTEERSGDVGGELTLPVAKGRAGKRKARSFEEEIRRKRTEQSAATSLLRKLREEDAIGIVEGDYNEQTYAALEERMLLEFRARITIHPLHQALATARSFISMAPNFGVAKGELQEMREVVSALEAMAHSSTSERTFLTLAETAGTTGRYRLILPIRERFLLVSLDDFAGEATFVAQVDRILRESDEVMALRLLRDAPQLPLEREGLIEALPEFVAAINELGIPTSLDDFVFKHPAVLLKPIMIFK